MSVLHSVSLIKDKCKGCTTCLKRCPTEAIRIKDGHAVIKTERCIDCGECIRVCPNKAKKATFDDFSMIESFKWKVALPAPSLYGQFDNLDDLDLVLTGLLDIGFDDVFEVASAAEIVSEYTRRYLHLENVPRPIISSACPAIVRIIAVRFPSLCENVLPLLPPIELAARLAKDEALKKNPSLKREEVGVFFVSPCPAKVSYVRNPIGIEKSEVDGALSMSDVCFRLMPAMKKITEPKSLCRTGLIGVGWAGSGGEATALFNDRYLAADGIENVIKVLDEIENGNIKNIEFLELNACSGGCVGGALNIVNPYISKARLQNLKRYLPVSQNRIFGVLDSSADSSYEIPKEYYWEKELTYNPVSRLGNSVSEAMKKMADIQTICSHFPDYDCGSCGAPSCRALAEDIVAGEAIEEDCIMRFKEQFMRGRYSDSEPKDTEDD